MKFTKKLFAVALALCLMLCLSIPAFAETYSDQSSVTIKKVYKLANGDMTSPAETFTLRQVGNGEVTDGDAESAPALGTITGADFAEGAATINGATGNITVALPTYDKVGVYEYTLQEVAGTTAGVTYYGDNIKLVVTVINDGEGKLRVAGVHTESASNPPETGKNKKDNFPNIYSAGKLTITKVVDGNLGDKSKDNKFNFTIKFTKPAGEVKSTIRADIAGVKSTLTPDWDSAGEWEYKFDLAHEDTATITNIPYGVKYEVKETNAAVKDGKLMNGDYVVTSTGTLSGEINSAASEITFTNTKEGEVDMGVTLDNLPYILVLVAVLGGAVVMFTRKRRFED